MLLSYLTQQIWIRCQKIKEMYKEKICWILRINYYINNSIRHVYAVLLIKKRKKKEKNYTPSFIQELIAIKSQKIYQ